VDRVRALGAPAAARRPASDLEQHFALIRLCEARLRDLGSFKFASRASWLFVLSSGIALVTLLVVGQNEAVAAVAARAVAGFSLLAGVSAGLGAARDLAVRDAEDGITAFVLERGLEQSALPAARFSAVAKRLALLVAAPSLVLALLALVTSPSLSALGHRALLCLGVIGYSLVFGLVISAVAQAARLLAPAHGRLMYVALMVGPLFVHQWSSYAASIPELLAWLCDGLLEMAVGS
jgi:hypothetical protein